MLNHFINSEYVGLVPLFVFIVLFGILKDRG